MNARATDLETKGQTLGAFVRISSAQVIAAVAGLLLVARAAVGGWSWGDVIVLVSTIALTGFFEWCVHLLLLHAPTDSLRMEKLGTGVGHRQHHLDPAAMVSLLLRAIDAAVFSALFAVFTALWVVPLMFVTQQALLGPYLTGYLLAIVGLLHYEWTHLLVHTKYRPKSRYYERLARNHRLHHYRNEHYWLGVTSNLGDRVLRTYPREKSDVPLSDTARTLS